MSPQPDNDPGDQTTFDSGVHIRDSERAPATVWQITLTAVLVIAILCVFFYGLTNQRVEVAGTPPAPPQQTNVPSTEQQNQNVGTTGQAPNPGNPRQPPKAGAAQPKPGDQNAAPPPGTPGKAR